MKELSLICNDFEVRQILEDRKTQLRRLVLPPPAVDTDCPYHEELGNAVIGRNCPMGERGDKTWVREAYSKVWAGYMLRHGLCDHAYRATFGEGRGLWGHLGVASSNGIHWQSPSSMPQALSRITLETQNTCIQRLQAITEPDAISEGMLSFPNTPAYQCAFLSAVAQNEKPPLGETPRERFERYWNTLYAKPKPVYYKKKIIAYQSFPWEDIQTILVHRNLPWRVMGNPFVWKCEFRRLHD